MRAKDLTPIFREITRIRPELAFHKRLLFKAPVGQVLRGIHFDPSGFHKDPFNVSAFIMPFCVPTNYYHMSFGIQIQILGEGWSMTMPDLLPKLLSKIREDAIPFLDRVSTLESLIVAMHHYPTSPHAWQASAYSLARIGETRRAVEAIERYIPELRMSSHWQTDIAKEFRALRHLLIYEPDLAATKLEEWETETIHNLGLGRFR